MLKILIKTNPQQVSVYTQAQKDGRSILYLCSIIYQQFLIHQLMHKWIVLKNNLEIYIKINIKTAPTCFGTVTLPSGNTLFVLATVTVVKIAN